VESAADRAPVRGAACGLLAALLFGLSTPWSKQLLARIAPQLLAGLLYLGAWIALLGYRHLRPNPVEASLKRSDLPLLVAIAGLGGVIAPVLMLAGLSRVTAVVASLLLNLEAPLTIGVAVLVYREHLGRGATLASGCVIAGAAALRLENGDVRVDVLGVALIALACLCWALDNNLTQRLSLRDPVSLVRAKALTAAVCNLILGIALGSAIPHSSTIVAALIVGAFAYGASIVLDAYALRLVGAAREAAYFATAPLFGVAGSVLFLGESIGGGTAAAMVFMALGVALLLRERHEHQHAHGELDHEHVHVHDLHHQHAHAASDPPGEPHSHPHRHTTVIHSHAHVSEIHHRHRH
jgi:drug/metabolite transporter (DMT)-like permease